MIISYLVIFVGSCFLSACQGHFLSQDSLNSDENQGQGKESAAQEKWGQKEITTPRQSYNSTKDRLQSQFDQVQQHWKKPKKRN